MTWSGDLGHPAVVAQSSTLVGGLESPRKPLLDFQGPDTQVQLPTAAFYDMVVDDLHRRVFIAGEDEVDALTFEGGLLARIPLSHVRHLSMSRDWTTVYAVTDTDNTIQLIDAATNARAGALVTSPATVETDRTAEVDGRLFFTDGIDGDARFRSLDPQSPEDTAFLDEAEPTMAPIFATSHDQPNDLGMADDYDVGTVKFFHVVNGQPQLVGGSQFDTVVPDEQLGFGPVMLSDDGAHLILNASGHTQSFDTRMMPAPGGWNVYAGRTYQAGSGGATYTHDEKFVIVESYLPSDPLQTFTPDKEGTVQTVLDANSGQVLRTVATHAAALDSAPFVTRDSSRLFWVTGDPFSPSNDLAFDLHVLHEPTWPTPCLTMNPVSPLLGTSLVSGTVRGPDGKGASNALVAAVLTSSAGSSKRFRVTGKTGSFVIPVPTTRPGSYKITVQAVVPGTGVVCSALSSVVAR
jgi:hypothetical protein